MKTKFLPLLAVIGLQLVLLNSSIAQSCIECSDSLPINNGLLFCAPMTGNANDVTPSPATPTISGTTVLSTDRYGDTNRAYDFSNSTTDRINYSGTSKLSLPANTMLSLSAWFYVRSIHSLPNMIMTLNSSNQSAYNIYIGGKAAGSLSGKIAHDDYDKPLNSGSTPISGSTVSLNTWHHVVVTIDSISGKHILYLDGIPEDTNTGFMNPAITNGFISLGNHAVNAWGLDGKVDDARIYNRVLSPTEVNQLYSSSLPVLTPISDKTICLGDSIQLIASGGTTYTWSPSAGLNDSSIADPYAKPISSLQYIVTISNGLCNIKDTVRVNVDSNCCYSCAASLPINSGLVFCAPMTGNANDVTPSPATPTISGATILTTDRVANSNSAYDFSNSTTDRINYSGNSKLSLTANTVLSLSAWFYARSIHSLPNIIMVLNSSNQSAYNIYIGGTAHGSYSGKILHDDYDNPLSSSSSPISGSTVSLNTWHHVVVTIDSASGKHILYLDGVPEDTNTGFMNPTITNGFVSLGNHAVNAWGLDGKVDDARIYTRVLSPTEVSTLYNCNYVNGFSKKATGITPINYTEKLAVWPNPSSNGLFEFSKNNLYNDLQINIYNHLGQLMEKDKYSITENKIDISTLNQGLYFVEFRASKTGETTTVKIAYW